MSILFRGTQTPDTRLTARGTISYSPSLLGAVVYSAVPGDVWAGRAAGVPAAKALLGVKERELAQYGVRHGVDLTYHRTAVNETYRLPDLGAVARSWVMPVAEAIDLLGV